jgi:hemin uptake protein HemP
VESAGREDAPHSTSSTLRIASSELFHGQRHIVIVHGGEEYRLHITKAGKLILTK